MSCHPPLHWLLGVLGLHLHGDETVLGAFHAAAEIELARVEETAAGAVSLWRGAALFEPAAEFEGVDDPLLVCAWVAVEIHHRVGVILELAAGGIEG